MPDEIVLGTATNSMPSKPEQARAIPMQVGNAIVFIATGDQSLQIQESDRIYAVALPSPKEAFENALEVIQECVGGIGKRLEALARELRPDEISVEFSLQFEGTGTAQIIPVLVTTQTKATGGIKVNAVWRQLDKKT
jgi:hypothetical protein